MKQRSCRAWRDGYAVQELVAIATERSDMSEANSVNWHTPLILFTMELYTQRLYSQKLDTDADLQAFCHIIADAAVARFGSVYVFASIGDQNRFVRIKPMGFNPPNSNTEYYDQASKLRDQMISVAKKGFFVIGIQRKSFCMYSIWTQLQAFHGSGFYRKVRNIQKNRYFCAQ